MNLRRSVKQFLRMCGHAMTSTVHERLDSLERSAEAIEIHLNSLEEGQASLLQAAIHSIETLHCMANRRVVETTGDPEAALIGFLYSYLPSQKAAELSAKPGNWLTASGYEIRAVEEEDVGLACAEWDEHLDELVGRMRALGYRWHLVLYQANAGIGYFANQSARVPGAVGTVLFFREYGVFAHALGWCAAALPATYFRPNIGG